MTSDLRFLDLPVELRRTIYRMTFERSVLIVKVQESTRIKALNVFLVCEQIYDEVLVEFCRHTTFVISSLTLPLDIRRAVSLPVFASNVQRFELQSSLRSYTRFLGSCAAIEQIQLEAGDCYVPPGVKNDGIFEHPTLFKAIMTTTRVGTKRHNMNVPGQRDIRYVLGRIGTVQQLIPHQHGGMILRTLLHYVGQSILVRSSSCSYSDYSDFYPDISIN